MENPHSILKKVFGYDSFRPGQEEIVSRLLAGQDVLAVMPTGVKQQPHHIQQLPGQHPRHRQSYQLRRGLPIPSVGLLLPP